MKYNNNVERIEDTYDKEDGDYRKEFNTWLPK